MVTKVDKPVALLLITILAVSSLITIKPALAQVGVTTPSIPAFDVTLQTYPHYIPPTYGVNPSTGKAVMTKEGYTEVEKWVRVEIGGQPFLRYNNSAGQLISLFYNVRFKGNHDTSWESIPHLRYEDAGTFVDSSSIGLLINIGFKGIKGPAEGWMELLEPNAAQIDFQVEALIGYYDSNDVFVGQSSGWSNTQTLTISDNSSTTTSGTSPSGNSGTPQIDFYGPTVAAVIILTVAVALAIQGYDEDGDGKVDAIEVPE